MTTHAVKSKKVSDLMTRNILVGHVTNSFTHTLRLFSEMTFHHLPILNADQELIGIISSNDMLKTLTLKMPFFKNLKDETINAELEISELMTPNPKVIHPDATIKKALEIFSKYHIHSLPVVKDKELIGIITSNDVLAALSD